MGKFSGAADRGGVFRYCPRQMRFLLFTFFIFLGVVFIVSKGSQILDARGLTLFMTSEVRTQVLLGKGENKESSNKLNKDIQAALFISLDSSLLKDSSDILAKVKKWSQDEPVLKYCVAEEFCLVHIIIYEDDKNLADSALRESIKKLFSAENSNSSSSFIHIVPNKKSDARAISNIVMESYIAGMEYFLLLTSVHIDSGRPIGLSLPEMMNSLHSLSPHDVGVVLLENPNKSKLSADVSGFLVSKIHIEIFGELFPFKIATLLAGLEFTSVIYTPGVSLRLRSGSTKVYTTGSIAATSKELPGDLMQEQKETLEGYIKAATASKDCLRCNIKSNNKVIAMSLYGTSPRYTMGALRNAQLFPVIFPGWRLWFYTEKDPKEGARRTNPPPPAIAKMVKELGAELRYIDTSATGLAPMLWRFTVAEEEDIEAFIIRDCDSRLTLRDAAVVAAWMKTDKAFHCIRDHPSHSSYSVSGGLWGGRPAPLREIFNGSLQSVMKRYGAGYVEDMHFLGRDVWPKVKDSHAYCHDSFSCQKYPSSFPFPVERKGYEHLGQVYDDHSIGRPVDIDILKNTAVNKKCVP